MDLTHLNQVYLFPSCFLSIPFPAILFLGSSYEIYVNYYEVIGTIRKFTRTLNLTIF